MTLKLSKSSARGKTSVLAAILASLALAGCDHLDKKPEFADSQVLLTPQERHPILVSEQPHRMSLSVSRGSSGLTPAQRAQLISFLSKFHATDTGNSKIVIAVPSGAVNEVAAMNAVADMRPILGDLGLSEAAVSIEPYHARGEAQPPIRVAYTRYAAEAPECGKWDDVGATSRNLHYGNYGCAYQRNIAAMVANPADLLGPRTMTPASAERRTVGYDKYVAGKVAITDPRVPDERAATTK